MTSTESKKRKRAPTPNLDALSMIGEDGARNAVHPSDVRGDWQRLKRRIWVLLIAVYLAVPWVQIGGKPAVLIDIPKRQFFFWGATFNAQDFWMMIFVALGVGVALFTLSASYGRAWCGFGCPQTVFLEGVYRRIERFFDGKHVQRRRLAEAPWTAGKLLRRAGKWGSWLLVSLVLTHTFLSYFMPIRELARATVSPPAEHPVAFTFIVLTTLVIYFNFAWFREQLCIVICPYGRLQSVLYDRDTVQVAYDHVRGEPRGKYRAGAESVGDSAVSKTGDCVDCLHCVAACPTGIDIRNGTQLECVGCANCIDACDDVMERLGRERGLVRMASQNEIEGGVRRVLRPRILLYVAIFLALMSVFAVVLSTRKAFEAKLLRQAGSPIQKVEAGVQNAFFVHVVNKAGETRRFELRIDAPAKATVVQAVRELELESFANRRVPVFVRFRPEEVRADAVLRIDVRSGDVSRELRLSLLGGRAR